MNWNKKYENAVKWYTTKGFKKIKNPATGFNVNLDLLTYLDEEMLNKMGENKRTTGDIKDLKDIGRGIKDAVNGSFGLEWKIKDMKLLPKLNKLTKYKTRIGGQAGIVNNHLHYLGIKNRLLITPIISKELKKRLKLSNTKLLTRNGMSKKENTKFCKKNYIFEYKKGFLGIAKRPNRFIVSCRPNNANPLLGISTIKQNYDELKNYDKFFMSGYHNLNTITEFKDAKKEIDLFNKAFKSIHYEIANVEDKKIRKELLKLLKGKIYSIGINEVELPKYTGKKNVLKGLKKLANITKAKRISYHTIGYFLTYYHNIPVNKDELNALIMADITAVSKAVTNKPNNFELHKNYELIPEGLIEIKKLGLKPGINGQYVIIPTKDITNLKYTVGLGDTISSTSYFLT